MKKKPKAPPGMTVIRYLDGWRIRRKRRWFKKPAAQPVPGLVVGKPNSGGKGFRRILAITDEYVAALREKERERLLEDVLSRLR